MPTCAPAFLPPGPAAAPNARSASSWRPRLRSASPLQTWASARPGSSAIARSRSARASSWRPRRAMMAALLMHASARSASGEATSSSCRTASPYSSKKSRTRPALMRSLFVFGSSEMMPLPKAISFLLAPSSCSVSAASLDRRLSAARTVRRLGLWVPGAPPFVPARPDETAASSLSPAPSSWSRPNRFAVSWASGTSTWRARRDVAPPCPLPAIAPESGLPAI